MRALLRACVRACVLFARSFSSLTSFSPWQSSSTNRMADVGTRRVKFLAVTSARVSPFQLGFAFLPKRSHRRDESINRATSGYLRGYPTSYLPGAWIN